MAKAEVIELLKSFISILRAEGIVIDRAYLYGSYQSGTATNDSDIDILVVTENESDDNLAGKIWRLTKEVDTKIEPFIVGKDRFESDDNSPLIEGIKRTGLKIA